MKDTTLGGLVRDARTPLIGRDAEMDALLDAFEAVMKRGETRIVSVVGPGGIGVAATAVEVGRPRGRAARRSTSSAR